MTLNNEFSTFLYSQFCFIYKKLKKLKIIITKKKREWNKNYKSTVLI